jgi:membrane-associated phospholipid phosphatase
MVMKSDPRERAGILKQWLIAFVAVTACVALSYFWIDRPASSFAHAQLRPYEIFAPISSLPKFIAPLALLAMLVAAVSLLLTRTPSKLQSAALLCGLCLLTSDVAENWLKYAFGRTWPETWVNNNPSFIHDGVFGFNPFHGGRAYAAFPSGHMTAICAMMTVLWIWYPRLRLVWAAAIALTAVGQLGANYHFVSDLIAGGFLGWSFGWIGSAVWNAPKYPASPTADGGGT